MSYFFLGESESGDHVKPYPQPPGTTELSSCLRVACFSTFIVEIHCREGNITPLPPDLWALTRLPSSSRSSLFDVKRLHRGVTGPSESETVVRPLGMDGDSGGAFPTGRSKVGECQGVLV